MAFRSENELEQAAIPFLKKNKLMFSWQVPLHNRVVDLAAMNSDGELIGIEFKLKDWKRAIQQAVRSINAFDYMYVCVPGGAYLERLKDNAGKLGVGVMVFDHEIQTIKIELTAPKITCQWAPNVEFLKNYLKARGDN